MNRLQQLYAEQGQSPWLDNLQRGYLTSGQLADARRRRHPRPHLQPHDLPEGHGGLGRTTTTSSADLVKAGGNVVDHYWAMALRDIRGALDVFAPVYESSNGGDGFAQRRGGARPGPRHRRHHRLGPPAHETIARPNLLVKIPATAEGVPAIRQMIGEGRSINVTLIFSLDRYNEVIEAYLQGLEAYDGDLVQGAQRGAASSSAGSTPRSTAASRRSARPRPSPCKGKAAVAQGKLAYQEFREAFSGQRWDALRAARAPGCSGRCGPRRRRRTPPTPTRSTSTASSAPTP